MGDLACLFIRLCFLAWLSVCLLVFAASASRTCEYPRVRSAPGSETLRADPVRRSTDLRASQTESARRFGVRAGPCAAWEGCSYCIECCVRRRSQHTHQLDVFSAGWVPIVRVFQVQGGGGRVVFYRWEGRARNPETSTLCPETPHCKTSDYVHPCSYDLLTLTLDIPDPQKPKSPTFCLNPCQQVSTQQS